MSNVEFSEEKASIASIQQRPADAEKKGVSDLPVRLGLAKDETGSTIILAAVGVFALILAIVIFVVAY